jgi:8-oxo-dGTP diphosphatase
MRQQYVVGLAFNTDRTKLILMRKNRPAWQAGKLNGVGGKFEPGETGADCMVREFFEETGVQTEISDWHYFTKIVGRDGDVFFFRMFDDKVLAAKTTSDEPILIVDANLDGAIRTDGLSNLPWLVGIALDTSQPFFFVEANYNQEFKTGKTGTESQ